MRGFSPTGVLCEGSRLGRSRPAKIDESRSRLWIRAQAEGLRNTLFVPASQIAPTQSSLSSPPRLGTVPARPSYGFLSPPPLAPSRERTGLSFFRGERKVTCRKASSEPPRKAMRARREKPERERDRIPQRQSSSPPLQEWTGRSCFRGEGLPPDAFSDSYRFLNPPSPLSN